MTKAEKLYRYAVETREWAERICRKGHPFIFRARVIEDRCLEACQLDKVATALVPNNPSSDQISFADVKRAHNG